MISARSDVPGHRKAGAAEWLRGEFEVFGLGRVHVWAICGELVGRRLLRVRSMDSPGSQKRFAPLTLEIRWSGCEVMGIWDSPRVVLRFGARFRP